MAVASRVELTRVPGGGFPFVVVESRRSGAELLLKICPSVIVCLDVYNRVCVLEKLIL